MVRHCTLVVAVMLMVMVLGCNSTGETKVGGNNTSTTADQLKVDPNWEAEPVRDWQVLTRPEKPATAENTAKPADAAKEMPAETPEDLTDEGADEVKEVPRATEGGASVEMVPEVKKPAVPEPVMDSHDATAAAMVAAEHMAVRELATLGAARCMVCDDVSDLTQCTTCGHHHKKSAQCPNEHLNSRCEVCYGKKGETVVVYPADAPCGACGTVHDSGPHCPHCDHRETENESEK